MSKNCTFKIGDITLDDEAFELWGKVKDYHGSNPIDANVIMKKGLKQELKDCKRKIKKGELL